MFTLLVLGKTSVDNRRVVVLDGKRHEVKAVRIVLLGKNDERFDFSVKNDFGVFVAKPNGKWRLPLTSDMAHLHETSEDCADYMEVISRDSLLKVKIDRAGD